MRELGAIAWRELGACFRTSVGWIVIAMFLLLSGFWVSFVTLRPGEPATLRAFFTISQWLLLIVAPAISMRLIAEERRAGTMEPLMTAPVSDWTIVVGKYLGALAFLVCLLAPTLLYVGLLEAVSDPEYGPIAAGYLALFLVGALYLAFGLLTSALTENQIVSLLSTLFFFIAWEALAIEGGRLLGPPWDRPLFAASILLRLADMAKGVVDTAHVVFFAAGSVIFVTMAVVAVESRRWR